VTTTTIPQRRRSRAARARDSLRRRGRKPSDGSPSAGPLQRVAGLGRRVAELEQEVQELRRLSHRLAELTDLVQELLVPAATRDDDRVRELLDRYDPGR
jgi:hypothetical protein